MYKVVVLGEGRVGKTSISKRWSSGAYEQGTRATVQAAMFTGKVQIGTKVITLNVWDTAGQEIYESIAPIYYKDADYVILCYSIIDSASFDKAKHWKKVLDTSVNNNVPCILVGNKNDLESQRCVPRADAEAYATSEHMKFYEASAKTGTNVTKIFTEIAQDLSSKQPKTRTTARTRPHTLDLTDTPQEEKKSCC